jgi:hypothetical protein
MRWAATQGDVMAAKVMIYDDDLMRCDVMCGEVE